MSSCLNIYTDGGARGNPGPGAIGVYILDQEGKEVASFGKKIGRTTNNVAEYKAVLGALDWIIENGNNLTPETKINLFMDSNLVYSQLSQIFKIKNPELRNLFLQVKKKESEIKLPVSYTYIPREKNTQADKLVNLALDRVE